jgi:carotenoid phi-ring synthase / carotenoid chi-ring synthase
LKPERKGILGSLVMARLGGSRHLVGGAPADLPGRVGAHRTVAVIGGGIAGMSAAALLAERGFAVTLFERNPYLGGKVGGWQASLGEGFSPWVDHGFHGFFPQYFNLRAMMERLGSLPHLVPIDDYLILTRDRGRFSFKGVARTPLLNMLSLRKTGLYRLGEMIKNPESRRLLAFLAYDGEKTLEALDGVSFKDFSDAAGIPQSMRIMFYTFSRSFFADVDLMSSAELIRSFHFYFLSNDLGLMYDYLNADYETAFLSPARRFLSRHGVQVRLSRAADRLSRQGARITVDDEAFDYAVLATDAGAARRIVGSSRFIAEEAPETYHRFSRLACSQGYAVLRAWLDRPFEREVPPFVATERLRFLDSITINHRVDPASAAWAREHRGSVLELHSYALPRDLRDPQEARNGLIQEMNAYLPELRASRLLHEHLQVRSDFSAFHTGMHRDRPTVTTGIPNLLAAGDWVRLPIPAMLMEAACSSALLAVNAICEQEGVRREPVYSVPLKGLFAR